MNAGPMFRTRKVEKVFALIGSSDAPPPRLPPCAGSSCARSGSEKHKRSGNSLMEAEYIAWHGEAYEGGSLGVPSSTCQTVQDTCRAGAFSLARCGFTTISTS